MNTKWFLPLTLILLLAPVAAAQKWEIGGAAGGGLYLSQNVTSPSGSGSVNIAPGIAASAWVGNSNGRLWGGELRYDYQHGDLEVSSQSTKARFGAQSHGIHYDFILHGGGREAKFVPFAAFGGGIKVYQGTGSEVASQPLNQLALLTKATDTRALGSVGAGIKFNARNLGFRIEVHDFITPFPNKVIAPAQNAKLGNWLNDIVVSFGLSLLL